MRIDVKTVKGKKYLQFIDNYGSIFHIGSASDFDSWLISAIMWDQQWTKEYYERRRDFFDRFESEMEKYVVLDDNKIELFRSVRFQTVYPSWEAGKRLRAPKIHLLGHLERNENIKQRRWRPWKWCLNEWGEQVQKRLDEIYSKQIQLARKNGKSHPLTEKEKQLKEIREQQSKTHKIVLEEEKTVLSVIKEIEIEKGTARKGEVIVALATKNKTPKEETERIINKLLREGALYEPWEGHLKIT